MTTFANLECVGQIGFLVPFCVDHKTAPILTGGPHERRAPTAISACHAVFFRHSAWRSHATLTAVFTCFHRSCSPAVKFVLPFSASLLSTNYMPVISTGKRDRLLAVLRVCYPGVLRSQTLLVPRLFGWPAEGFVSWRYLPVCSPIVTAPLSQVGFGLSVALCPCGCYRHTSGAFLSGLHYPLREWPMEACGARHVHSRYAPNLSRLSSFCWLLSGGSDLASWQSPTTIS